jgi:maltose alpha-D-glucosyltransferase/alpha-amylase
MSPSGAADWYKDAVFYEVHVKAFMDGNGDGIGDFAGLTARLDYLVDLGVDCLWLLPMYASPLRDDGYDIADFYALHPSYGTAAEFRALLEAAHARGLRVIADLVMNHTSDQHPWFQASRQSATSPFADYYVWSQTDDRYRDARSSSWTEVQLDLGRRPAGLLASLLQPPADLNYDNPASARPCWYVMRYWLDQGSTAFAATPCPT